VAEETPRPGRWKRRLLLAAAAFLALLAGGFLARNFLLRKGTEAAVAWATGFPLEIGRFDLGLVRSRLEIDDLRLLNPGGFEDPRCIRVPRVVADVEVRSAFRDELHIEEIVLDVAEVVVVRNAKGETNLDRLEALGGGEKAPAEKKPGGKKPAGEGKEHRWRCDRLDLSMGKVLYIDYTRMKDGKPKEESFDLDVRHEVFRDVTSPKEVVKIIVWKVLKGTPVRLLNASVESLQEGLGSVVGGVAGAAGDAVKGVGDAIGGLFGGKKEPEPAKKKRR
jgi:hypothetical protein